MRYYFGENGWPKSKLGDPPKTEQEEELLINSLQVRPLLVIPYICHTCLMSPALRIRFHSTWRGQERRGLARVT